ncbi:hypothetical protein GCM10011518_00120 [Flavobacterium limi]|uniref:Secretion system C-terminal sorting domain-containing protein n=2 Tax=Flavobacterium limi TaxID=2045105 RepID=A0ABQ1TGA4_9FLAO|nr:hypothetical protein GCM10011518_00120 [Flavobacterium limi]
MMKKILLLFIFYTGVYNGIAQQATTDYITQININLYDVGDLQNHPTGLFQLEALTNEGNTNCMNWLGILYNEGLGVEKNENTAFELIKKAASLGNSTAAYNLGRFYMIGTGCDIDFDKAKYWLTASADQGNERAAYGLGYMYYKGFGVEQNYKTAVSWFELSNFPMAKHWLGICYYFGYGVVKDEQKAIINFTKSQTPNSNMMLKHIFENVKDTVDSTLDKQINEKETSENSAIAKETIEKTIDTRIIDESKTEKRVIKPKYLNGKWKGKLIELDWSGKEITRILPVSLEFVVHENEIEYKWKLNNHVTENTTILEDNSLYFENLNMTLDLPFSDNSLSNTLKWQILSAQMDFKTINKKTYLTANLETFTSEWQEPGPPMRLILKDVNEASDELSDEELIAISEQKDKFIAFYPNPFVTDVLIAYELEKDANVSVSVYDLSGNSASINLEQETLQKLGPHHYTLDGTNLKSGMYVVRVSVDNQVHTRILIKQ